ncbi:MAG: tripartite tricarboxylate transporter substrate-binding protein, partial [Pollutimonas bauzanensis]
AGFKDFDINTWIGLLAPAGTPDAVVQRLHSEVVRIVREPDVREQFRTLGMLPVADSPAEFGAQISAELSMYKKLVDASGARPD